MPTIVVKSAVSASVINSWNVATSQIKFDHGEVKLNTYAKLLDKDVRSCEVRPVVFSKHRKLYNDMLNNLYPYIDFYECDFNTSLYRRLEIQHITYNAGDHFTNHTDIIYGSKNNPTTAQRKISCILMLSNSSEFEGGDLIIEDKQIDLDMGDLVLFQPTYVHRVERVVKGTRRALVSWVLGPPWR